MKIHNKHINAERTKNRLYTINGTQNKATQTQYNTTDRNLEG